MSGEAGSGSGSEEEGTNSVFHILHQLIRSGQVRLIAEDNQQHRAEESSSEDEEDNQPLTLREALESADNLMMGGGQSSDTSTSAYAPPDTSLLDKNDIKSILELASGEYSMNTGMKRCRNIVGRCVQREMGMPRYGIGASTKSGNSQFTSGDRAFLCRNFLPNKKRIVARHRTKTFCSQFSSDGEILLTASQDHALRFYRKNGTKMYPWKEFTGRDVGWSILDVALSPDGRHLIYGTWSDFVHEFSVHSEEEKCEAYNLQSRDYRFCVFSLRYSDDGREILAGASDRCLYIYSRDEKRRLLKIDAHEDDINAVCFGDAASNIIYSGGDDGLLKVWDRRELQESNPRPVGILAGHCDGVTFIDSKGDGRYLISNSKDQSIKLWDIRKFSTSSALEATREAVSRQHWDYRWQSVPKKARRSRKLAGDSSIMTYRGHTVLHTLIRAYFSPQFSTGQRYIYCGCARGSCCIYDILTGKMVKTLEGHHSCVRDVSWHPHEMQIITSSWDGSTALWRYDERRSGNINPDSPEGDTGDEDTSDEEGRRYPRPTLRRKMLRQQMRKRRNLDTDTDREKRPQNDGGEIGGSMVTRSMVRRNRQAAAANSTSTVPQPSTQRRTNTGVTGGASGRRTEANRRQMMSQLISLFGRSRSTSPEYEYRAGLAVPPDASAEDSDDADYYDADADSGMPELMTPEDSSGDPPEEHIH